MLEFLRSKMKGLDTPPHAFLRLTGIALYYTQINSNRECNFTVLGKCIKCFWIGRIQPFINPLQTLGKSVWYILSGIET